MLNTLMLQVMYDGLIRIEAPFPPPTARRTPHCVERSGQIEGTGATRGPRRPRCPVVCSQSQGTHPASAWVHR